MTSSEPADLRLVPDMAYEWLYVLGRLEELLLTLALWEDEGAELPDPIAGRAALDALDNVYDAVRPTQSEDEATPRARATVCSRRPLRAHAGPLRAHRR